MSADAPRLRIGIDYRVARTHAPGIGRYVRELVRALAALPEGPELRLLDLGSPAPAAVPESALGLARPAARVVRRRIPVPRRAGRLLGACGLGADRLVGGADVFLSALSDPLPVARALRFGVVSEFPAHGSAEDASFRAALAAADHCFVFSADAAVRLAARYGRDPATVHAVPVGCDHWARELDAGAAASAARASGPPQILALGAPLARRRPLALLRAAEVLAARGVEIALRFAGARGPRTDEFAASLAASPLRGRVTWDLPGEAALPELVARSALLVHLNDDEATPVTPLEAFACGAGVVASRLPAFEEALAGLARFVDNAALDRDPGVLADAIGKELDAASSGGESAKEARRAVAARHRWLDCARATVRAWETAAAAADDRERDPGAGGGS